MFCKLFKNILFHDCAVGVRCVDSEVVIQNRGYIRNKRLFDWKKLSFQSARLVAVSYKPQMLVTRVRLPACAIDIYQIIAHLSNFASLLNLSAKYRGQ